MDLKGLFRTVVNHVAEKSPEILTALGLGGMLTTVVLSVHATPEANRRADHVRREKHKAKLSPVEYIQATWKCWIGPALIFTASAACEVGAVVIENKRNTALAALCSLAETGLSEYRSAAKEVLGEEKANDIQKKADENHVRENPPTPENTSTPKSISAAVDTRQRMWVTFPQVSDKYYKLSIDDILDARNRLNKSMAESTEPWVSIGDFFYELGIILPNELGESRGFNVHRDFIKIEEPIHIVDHPSTLDGTDVHSEEKVATIRFIGPGALMYDFKYI